MIKNKKLASIVTGVIIGSFCVGTTQLQPVIKGLYLLIGIMLSGMTYWDLEKHVIPNKLTATVLIMSLIRIFLNIELAIIHGITGVITFSILYITYILSKKQLGVGDIKILTVLSLFLGPEKILTLLFLSTLLAGIFSLIGLATKKINKKTELPFMPFIFISYYYVILM